MPPNRPCSRLPLYKARNEVHLRRDPNGVSGDVPGAIHFTGPISLTVVAEFVLTLLSPKSVITARKPDLKEPATSTLRAAISAVVVWM